MGQLRLQRSGTRSLATVAWRTNLWYVSRLSCIQRYIQTNEQTSGFVPKPPRSVNTLNGPNLEPQRSEWDYSLAWKILPWTNREAKRRDKVSGHEWQEALDYHWVRVHR